MTGRGIACSHPGVLYLHCDMRQVVFPVLLLRVGGDDLHINNIHIKSLFIVNISCTNCDQLHRTTGTHNLQH